MKYVVRNRKNHPVCAACGKPISLFFSGWRHVGPWPNTDKHKAILATSKKSEASSS